MSTLQILEHMFNEHHTRATREGRGEMVHVLALIKETVMATVSDLQGRISAQGDKIAQLEADVNDLVAKSGGTAPPASNGLSVTQDQVDSMANAMDANNARIDKLVQTVVNGPQPAPTNPVPTAPPDVTPISPVITPPPATLTPGPGPATQAVLENPPSAPGPNAT